MNDLLTYLFWPNPGNADYGSPKALALLIVCLLLVVASFAFSMWRRRSAALALRRVSGGWSAGLLWFGLIGIVLVVSRVEQIQFLAMRFLWVLWIAAAAFFLFLQVKIFRARYYEVIPDLPVEDPRAKYLPGKKKRR